MGCNCGGSVPRTPQEPREFRGNGTRRPRQSGPPRPLREGGPGDPNGGYYAKPAQPREWNGPKTPDRD